MVRYKKVPVQTSIALRYEHQRSGKSIRQLVREYGFPRSTVHRHATKPMPTAQNPPPIDGRHKNKGRPRIIDERSERDVRRAVNSLRVSNGLSFSADEVREQANLQGVHRRTVSRCLQRLGYRKRNLRKKGQLTAKDRRIRVRFARDILSTKDVNYWRNNVCMFLDGVSFVHKTNPFMKAVNQGNVGYRKVDEGLKVTAKGAKEGVNGKTAHFFVGISHGKGVVFCKQFNSKYNGRNYAEWIKTEFPPIFRRVGKGRDFVQDGDPVQNSAVVKTALQRMRANVVSIPARSPDLNPIENVFNNVRRALSDQALNGRIVRETYDEYSERVRTTLLNFSPQVIDSTIANMHKRCDMIVKSRGYRTKY